MNGHYIKNAWSIIEEGFNPSMQEASESIFSLGNGRMGQRANYEERYSGITLPGNYLNVCGMVSMPGNGWMLQPGQL